MTIRNQTTPSKKVIVTAIAGCLYVMGGWMWIYKRKVEFTGGDIACMIIQMLFSAGLGAALGYINDCLNRKSQSSVSQNSSFILAQVNSATIGFALIGTAYAITSWNWVYEDKISHTAIDELAIAIQAISGMVGGGVFGDTFKHARLFLKNRSNQLISQNDAANSHHSYQAGVI